MKGKNALLTKAICRITFIMLFIQTPFKSTAQPMQELTPMIGAEVFIEPGQTPEMIDNWYRLMKDNGLSICRIRMFETYMHKPDGSWDFTLFDQAYRSAEKYGIKVWGNLFPATDFTDVGGFKFPHSEKHLQEIADYIKNLVTHFKQFKSCYGWVLINEPGSGKLPDEPFTQQKFNEWKSQHNIPPVNSQGYHVFTFDAEKFLVDYNTWFLQWLKDEVYKYDPGSHLHVNNHAIFQNVAEYDFPAWRNILTSLGGSAHASWHFGYFRRDQYAVAMSANSEIIRSGAGNIPWLMTELQGGNNIYSGYNAMCPTKEEIAQWLWTVIGSGGKGGIFWTLNPRASGFEAGEWAMVDFQNHPSDRLLAAASVAETLNSNAPLFAKAVPAESGINILYIRESLWTESILQSGGPHLEGRDKGGVMKSALSYFEALGEIGLQSNLKEIDEFDFSREDYKGTTIILAHQVAIPSRYWKPLEDFVSKGGKLLIEGLTAYYDENAHCIMQTGFPLKNLLGAEVKEFKLEGNLFRINLNNPSLLLPAHCWQGYLNLQGGTAIGQKNGLPIAVKNNYGKGETVWIPTLVGLAGRIDGYGPLQTLLVKEFAENINSAPVVFKSPQKLMLMKTLRSGNSLITVIINKGENARKVELVIKNKLKPAILFADKNGSIDHQVLSISPEETMVLKWDGM